MKNVNEQGPWVVRHHRKIYIPNSEMPEQNGTHRTVCLLVFLLLLFFLWSVSVLVSVFNFIIQNRSRHGLSAELICFFSLSPYFNHSPFAIFWECFVYFVFVCLDDEDEVVSHQCGFFTFFFIFCLFHSISRTEFDMAVWMWMYWMYLSAHFVIVFVVFFVVAVVGILPISWNYLSRITFECLYYFLFKKDKLYICCSFAR